jgi:hypothetical protein
MSLLEKSSKHRELTLKNDLLAPSKDFDAVKYPNSNDNSDLEDYFDFLEEIGAFESKKKKTKFYREEFVL